MKTALKLFLLLGGASLSQVTQAQQPQQTATVRMPTCLVYPDNKTYVPCTGVVPVDSVTGNPLSWQSLMGGGGGGGGGGTSYTVNSGTTSTQATPVQSYDGSKLATEVTLGTLFKTGQNVGAVASITAPVTVSSITGAVTIGSSALPTGAATETTLDSLFKSGQSIGNTVFGSTQSGSWNVGVTGSVAVTGSFYQATQPVSVTALPLPAGAATEATSNTLFKAGQSIGNTAFGISGSLPAGTNTIGAVNLRVNDANLNAIANTSNTIGSYVSLNTNAFMRLFNGTNFVPWSGDANGAYVQGNVASGVADAGNPLKIGGVASATAPAVVTAGSRVNAWLGLSGQQMVGISDPLPAFATPPTIAPVAPVDMSPITVNSLSATGDLTGSIDTTGYNSVAWQLSGTFVGTVTAMTSNNGTVWNNAGQTFSGTGIVGNAAANSTTTQTTMVSARYFKLVVTAYTSGTIGGSAFLRTSEGIAPGSVTITNGATVGLATGVNLVGSVASAPPAAYNAANGLAPVFTSVTAGGLVLKASPALLYGLNITASTSSGFLMIFNSTTVPADGTVTPVRCLPVNAGAGLELSWRDMPLTLTVGASVAFSSTGCFTKTASATAFIAGEVK